MTSCRLASGLKNSGAPTLKEKRRLQILRVVRGDTRAGQARGLKRQAPAPRQLAGSRQKTHLSVK